MSRKLKDSEPPKIAHQGFTQLRRSLHSGESIPTKPDLAAQMLSIAGNVTKGFTFRKQDVAVEEPTADEGDDSEEGPYRQRRCEPTRNAHFQPLM